MKQVHIGEIIKQRRMELGMTQEELCEGICESATISRIETGKQTPSRSKLNALLGRLGLPGEKYYALMSENELEIERLKAEILDCNTRGLCREGLEKLEQLAALTDSEDHLTQQFIARSRVLLGREEKGDIVPYSTEEKLALLFRAMEMTVPSFDLDEIGRHWYSLDEMKIINQIAIVYGDSGQRRQAIDIFYQLMKHIKKRLTINADNVATAILISYNYALLLCRERRYEEAMELAEWGWDTAVEWGRGSHVGGLLYVLGESLYRTGHIEESKDYYIQSYYAYLVMKNTSSANIIRENIQEYYSIEV